MKTLILIAIASVSMTASAAVYESTTNNCQALREAVRINGWQEITVGGKGKVLYTPTEKNEFCDQWQRAVQGWVPTADAKNCPVGFFCQDKNVLGGALSN